MILQFGKFFGRSIYTIALKEPSYAWWLAHEEAATGKFLAAQEAVRELIRRFNEKSFVMPCQGPKCKNLATRGSVYCGTPRPRWFCDDCNEYQLGASPGKLEVVRTYGDAVQYVDTFCRGDKGFLRILIRELGRARGLPWRVSEAQAAAFFA
jgi:hypothetical protein